MTLIYLGVVGVVSVIVLRFFYVQSFKASAKAVAPHNPDTLRKLNDVKNSSPNYYYGGKAIQLQKLEDCLEISRLHLKGYREFRWENASWWELTNLRAIADEEWLQDQLIAFEPTIHERLRKQEEARKAEEERQMRQDAQLQLTRPTAAVVEKVIDLAQVRACFDEVARRIGGR